MALRLEHFTPAENPDLFYRRVGYPAVEDFMNRGSIAGTAKYGTEAYFLRGGEWSTSGAPYRITMDTAKLNPLENKLYGDLNFNRYLTKEGVFPVGGASGGNYPRLTPNLNASYLDRINPLNRYGIKIDDTITGKIIYDRTNPVLKTPVSTNLKNALVEAKIFGNATMPYVDKALQGTGTFMNYAGIVPLVTSEVRRQKADFENPVTGEVYKKDEVTTVDGRTYSNSDLETIARYHPDNADLHPEITDAMRKKFNPKWFEK
jgi:hypothetical protein